MFPSQINVLPMLVKRGQVILRKTNKPWESQWHETPGFISSSVYVSEAGLQVGPCLASNSAT